MSARRGEGLSGGCKAVLTLKEKDSFLLLPRPWSRSGAAVEMGQRSVHQAHTTPVNSVHVSAPCVDMFGDSMCAREADDTAAESWHVPLYEGVHPVCRLDSATGWRSGCRRAGGLVEPFIREKTKTGTGVHNEGGGCGRHTKRAEG